MSILIRQIFNDTASSYVRFFLSCLMAFVLTPLMVYSFGKEDFGLWSLIFALLGFFELLDMGFYNACIKYVAASNALKDPHQKNKILSTLFFSYVLLALIGLAIAGIISLGFNSLFFIPEEKAIIATKVFWILTIRSLVIGLPFSLFKGILFGENKIPALNWAISFSYVVYSVIAYFALKNGMGIVPFALLNLGQFVLENGLCLILAYLFTPGLSISLKKIDFGFLKEASSFSLMQFTANTSSMLTLKTDPLIINSFLSLSAVTLYALPMKLVTYLYMLIKQFTNTLGPKFSAFHVAKDPDKIKVLFFHSLKIVSLIAALILIGGIFFSDDFFKLWVGKGFEESSSILIILLASFVLNTIQILCNQVLSMVDEHVRLTPIFVATALINVVASCILVFPFGIQGVAFGTFLSACYGMYKSFALMMNVYPIGWNDLVKWSVVPSMIPSAVVALAFFLLKSFVSIDSFLILSLSVCAGTGLFFAAAWIFSIDEGEKSAISKAFF